jgi:hypothetical protein
MFYRTDGHNRSWPAGGESPRSTFQSRNSSPLHSRMARCQQQPWCRNPRAPGGRRAGGGRSPSRRCRASRARSSPLPTLPRLRARVGMGCAPSRRRACRANRCRSNPNRASAWRRQPTTPQTEGGALWSKMSLMLKSGIGCHCSLVLLMTIDFHKCVPKRRWATRGARLEWP